MKPVRMFPYMGSKLKHLETIVPVVDGCGADTYCEPFLGSGAVLLNLGGDYGGGYYVAEECEPIRTFMYDVANGHLTRDNLRTVVDWTNRHFDTARDDDYYRLRDAWNKGAFKSWRRGAMLVVLIMTCRSNMARFNAAWRFNQTAGRRHVTEAKLEPTFAAMAKLREMHAARGVRFYDDWRKAVHAAREKGVGRRVFLVDPPYYLRPMGMSAAWSEAHTAGVLATFGDECDRPPFETVVYTDVANWHGDEWATEKYRLKGTKMMVRGKGKARGQLDEVMYVRRPAL